MIHPFAVAVGAGCAAAFLFAVSSQTSPLAMTLAYLVALRIMIATMGWGYATAAASAATSVAGLTLLAEPLTGLLYAASVAAPAWMLAAFASAPVARRILPVLRPDGTYASVVYREFTPRQSACSAPGAVLTAIIIIYGGYAEGAKQVTTALAALASDALDAKDVDQANCSADTLPRSGPAAIAASTLLMLSINLYAASRSTQLSHRLQRPWSDLPTSLRLPWPLGILAIGCAACAYALPAPASQYFSIVVGGSWRGIL